MIAGLSLLGMPGCAQMHVRDGLPGYPDMDDVGHSGQGKEMVVLGVPLENTTFDYPVVVNSRVERWVEYFTGRGRAYFTKYLERSEYFLPYIKPILVENGLPQDLVYLAMIESGFSNHARSRAKAVGPWQFIRSTGRSYGLRVDWWVDERKDIELSTRAAARYLKDLYGLFHRWELASAAYNAGENKIARAVRRYGTTDFWALTRQRFLKSETRNYVPKIMAAAILAKNREQFGFPPSGNQSPVVDDREELILTDAGVGAEFPMEMDGQAVEYVNGQARPTSLATLVPTPNVNRRGELEGNQLVEFEISSPADLFKVGRAAGISYREVKRLNPGVLRWCTHPLVPTMRIKLPAKVQGRFMANYNDTDFKRRVKFRTYKVKRGDTLGRIARRFGITVSPIKDLNSLKSNKSLRAGKRILLPIPGDRYQSLSSLDLFDQPVRKKKRRKGGKKYYKVSYKSRKAARSSSKDGI